MDRLIEVDNRIETWRKVDSNSWSELAEHIRITNELKREKNQLVEKIINEKDYTCLENYFLEKVKTPSNEICYVIVPVWKIIIEEGCLQLIKFVENHKMLNFMLSRTDVTRNVLSALNKGFEDVFLHCIKYLKTEEILENAVLFRFSNALKYLLEHEYVAKSNAIDIAVSNTLYGIDNGCLDLLVKDNRYKMSLLICRSILN